MNIKILNRNGMSIKKYEAYNITVLVGTAGSGKTFTLTKYLEHECAKKLLMASSDDCENEFLTVSNIDKVSYYDSYYNARWELNVSDNFTSLLREFKNHVSNDYEVVIIDNILYDSYNQIVLLFKECLKYPKVNFFIVNSLELNITDNEFNFDFFLEK